MPHRRRGRPKLRDDPIAVVRITDEFGPPLYLNAHRGELGMSIFRVHLGEDAHIRVGCQIDADLFE